MNHFPLPKWARVALLFLAVVGCGKKDGKADPWADVAPGEWQRVGACGLSVAEVRHGKVKGQGMMGEGQSQEKVFIIRTRFRNFDDTTPVKYIPWQNDGAMFVNPSIVLKDDKGNQYKLVQFGMFGKVEGRQKPDVELKAADAPLDDVLTFEGKAAEAAVLFLELPARWYVPGAGKGWQLVSTQEPFRYRIPRPAWEGKKDPEEIFAEVAPGRWERSGPVGMTIDEVRVGKVKTDGFPGKGESREDVFLIRTRFKNFDDKLTIKYIPWQIETPFAFTRDIVLKDEKGDRFSLVVFGLFGSPQGRQKTEVELRASDPPVGDLLTFDGKAGGAAVLFLELPAQWQQQGPQGWQPGPKGHFRYRLPRALWAK